MKVSSRDYQHPGDRAGAREPQGAYSTAKASIGIFGQQFIPTVITMVVFRSVMITRLWSMAQSAKLDEEALATVERGLMAHTSAKTDASGGDNAVPATKEVLRCTNCGAQVQPSAKFCSERGSRIAA